MGEQKCGAVAAVETCVLSWSLTMLQSIVVAAASAAGASCCWLLLHPALPCSALEGASRALSGLRALVVPPPQAPSPTFHLWSPCSGHTPLQQLLQGIWDAGSAPQLHPSLNHPLPERKPWGADVGEEAGAGSQLGHPSHVFATPLLQLGEPPQPHTRKGPCTM